MRTGRLATGRADLHSRAAGFSRGFSRGISRANRRTSDAVTTASGLRTASGMNKINWKKVIISGSKSLMQKHVICNVEKK